MHVWRVQAKVLRGSSTTEVLKKARYFFRELEKKSKRETFIRCRSLEKKKIFFRYYWEHLLQKHRSVQRERAKLLPCACELLQESTLKPDIYTVTERKNEKYLRWYGKTLQGQHFAVQVKFHLPTNKYFSHKKISRWVAQRLQCRRFNKSIISETSSFVTI